MDYNYTQSNLKPTPRLTQTTLTYLTKTIINKISQKKKKKKKKKRKRSQTSHTQSKQISTQITFRRNLLYVPLKESFFLSMRKDPQLKVTQSFPTILTIPIYKAQILFIDGQRISNYFCNREHFFILYQGELFSSTIRKTCPALTKET